MAEDDLLRRLGELETAQAKIEKTLSVELAEVP